MSLLALLAAGTPREGEAPDPAPEPADATIAAMRPSGRLIFSTIVAADGSGDHLTLEAATQAAHAAQSAKMAQEGQAQPTPNYRTRIVVKPGTYYETNFTPPRWGELIGAGSDQVLIQQELGVEGGGIFSMHGGQYVEGVTLHSTNTATEWVPKYPVHMVNNFTTIFVDVDFKAEAGKYAYGSDGSDHGLTVFYQCRSTGTVFAHGWESTLAGQATVVVACEFSSLLWDSMNATAPDEVWVVDSTVSGQVQVKGASSTLHLDPASAIGPLTKTGSQDARTDWPVPTGGLSAYDRARYGM